MSEQQEAKNEVEESLLAEARLLANRIRSQTAQVERLRALVERIEGQTAADRSALADLEGCLGTSAQLMLDDLDDALGGKRLERVAIRLLRERLGGEAEVHYREWFDLVRLEGYEIKGKNPLGTFLTQLNRSSSVEPVGARSGRYRLRAAA